MPESSAFCPKKFKISETGAGWGGGGTAALPPPHNGPYAYVPNVTFSRIAILYRAFSFTLPAAMQISWNKIKCLHKKRVQLPQYSFGSPTWPTFYIPCFHVTSSFSKIKNYQSFRSSSFIRDKTLSKRNDLQPLSSTGFFVLLYRALNFHVSALRDVTLNWRLVKALP